MHTTRNAETERRRNLREEGETDVTTHHILDIQHERTNGAPPGSAIAPLLQPSRTTGITIRMETDVTTHHILRPNRPPLTGLSSRDPSEFVCLLRYRPPLRPNLVTALQVDAEYLRRLSRSKTVEIICTLALLKIERPRALLLHPNRVNQNWRTDGGAILKRCNIIQLRKIKFNLALTQ